MRHRRWGLPRPHVGPDDPSAVDAGIGGGTDAGLEVGVLRLVRHIEAAALGVELPAVVDAAQTTFFVSPEEQRCAAVRTEVGHQADLAGAVPEADQLLAEQHHPHGVAVWLGELGREHRGDPVLPHEGPHRRTGTDASDEFVFFLTEHAGPPRPVVAIPRRPCHNAIPIDFNRSETAHRRRCDRPVLSHRVRSRRAAWGNRLQIALERSRDSPPVRGGDRDRRPRTAAIPRPRRGLRVNLSGSRRAVDRSVDGPGRLGGSDGERIPGQLPPPLFGPRGKPTNSLANDEE